MSEVMTLEADVPSTAVQTEGRGVRAFRLVGALTPPDEAEDRPQGLLQGLFEALDSQMERECEDLRWWARVGEPRATAARSPVLGIAGYVDGWLGGTKQLRECAPGRFSFLPEGTQEPSLEVLRFCQRGGLTDYLLRAIALAKHYLDPADSMEVEVEQDPEAEDEWLVLNVPMHGRTDEIVSRYERYVGAWVGETPWPESGKIRVSYSVV